MSSKTSHVCDRCEQPSVRGVTIEAVGWDDRFDSTDLNLMHARYPQRDLCSACHDAFCAWFSAIQTNQ